MNKIVLALGSVLFLYQAFFHLDVVYPDEHFQTLEVANRIVNGYGWLASEWQIGMRSYAGPGFFVPILWVLKQLGIQGGDLPIRICRAFIALLSVITLWRFDTLLAERRLAQTSRLIALLCFATLPAMVVWMSTTLTETLSLILLWSVLPWCLKTALNREASVRAWFFSGILISLSFFVRPHMLAWIVPFLFCASVLTRPSLTRIAASWCALLVVILLYGLLDYVTWGHAFQSLTSYWNWNVNQGVASHHGTSPWYSYFELVFTNLGSAFITFFIAVHLLGSKRGFRTQDVLVFVPSGIFILVHSFIAHKELRFILPIFPALFYSTAVAFNGVLEKFNGLNEALRKTFNKPASVMITAIFFATICFASLDDSRFFSKSDAAELSVEVQKRGLLQNENQDCLLLVNHYWIWTRGEMVHGRRIRFIERSLRDLTPNDLNSCRSAIVERSAALRFQVQAGAQWKPVKQNIAGHSLFVQD